jgi:hypothetical protein
LAVGKSGAAEVVVLGVEVAPPAEEGVVAAVAALGVNFDDDLVVEDLVLVVVDDLVLVVVDDVVVVDDLDVLLAWATPAGAVEDVVLTEAGLPAEEERQPLS